MKKGVLFFISCSGLMLLSVLTVYVIFFEPSIQNLSNTQIKVYHPKNELAKTETGRKIVEITNLLESRPKEGQQALLAFEKTIENEISALESTYFTLAQRINAINNKDSALTKSINLRLEELSDNRNLYWLKIQLLIEKSSEISRQGNLATASKLIRQAISESKRHHFLFLLPSAYNVAGYISNAENLLMDAQTYFMKGIEVSNRIGDTSYLIRFYNNIGILYLHIEKWTKALEYLDKAQHSPIPYGLEANRVLQVIHLNKAFIYSKLNDLENMTASYEESLKYYDDRHANPNLKTLKLKGDTQYYVFSKQYKQAINAANTCSQYSESFKYPLQLGQCQIQKAEAQLKLGDYQEALYTIEDTIVTFSSINHKRWLIKAYEKKADILEALGETGKALLMYKQYYEQDKNHLLSKVYDLEHAFVTQHMRQEQDLLNVQNQLGAAQLAKEKLRFQIACTWIFIALIFIIFALRKASLIKNENKELHDLSYIDELTKLHNRRHYQRQLSSDDILSREQHYQIALFDLDNFKSVNDTFGHDVGDEVLTETAKRLSGLVSGAELLIRWGGEEFLVLMRSDDHIETRINAMLKCINSEAFLTQAGALDITVSIGVSKPALPSKLCDSDDSFRKADQNLYEAKRSGKNRAVFPKSE